MDTLLDQERGEGEGAGGGLSIWIPIESKPVLNMISVECAAG